MNKPPMGVWIVLAVILVLVSQKFNKPVDPREVVAYSQFLEGVRGKKVKSVTLTEGSPEIRFQNSEGKNFETIGSERDKDLISKLETNNVQFEVNPHPEQSPWLMILISWGPMILLIGVWIFFMRKMQGGQGGGGGIFGFGKSKARLLDQSAKSITFADVAGCDEAKEDVKEIVEFLKSPEQFQKLGGRIPRGVLLVGPPGTGKTLLAKAIAGEAKVAFFSISGSDFVEMFVGVGAARVRDMFMQARKNAPCIIFVDEIDAMGRSRSSGFSGGNDEREQTLNQMLVEMDGFDTNASVIVIAATNRPDILDKALLRPGRFDRQVYVTLPDIRGREQVLNVHMRKIPASPDVKASIIARGTPGMSGADLANLVNEAALFAARRKGRLVEMIDFEKAKDKILMGPAREAMVMSLEERKNTAYHESGHALVAKLVPKSDPVHKVTIIPRGRALGVTIQLPEADRYSLDDVRMRSTLAVLLAGRIAEEVFMQQMTTGASNDFERATKIAREMVMRYGMSKELGVMVYADNESDPRMGESVSEATMQKVDAEVRKIIDEAYNEARKLVEDNKEKMHAMAKALLDWETIDGEQIDEIMAGKTPTPPKDLEEKSAALLTLSPQLEEVPGIDPETARVARDIGIVLDPSDKRT